MPKYKDVAVEYKDGEQEDGGYIIAYASTFDRDPDCYGDVVAKGAFLKSLAKHEAENNPIQFLFGHRTDDPMYNIGTVIEAKEDERGLLVTAEFDPSNEKAQYARKLVKEGRLKKLSFAYDVIDQATVVLEDGRKANELREVDIFEVSLVPIPANQHAEVVLAKDASDAEEAGDQDPAAGLDDATDSAEAKDEKQIATAYVNVVTRFDEDELTSTLEQFKDAIEQTFHDAIADAIKRCSAYASQGADIVPTEGDPSTPEASEVGGKGAPEVDAEFLAKFHKYIEHERED